MQQGQQITENFAEKVSKNVEDGQQKAKEIADKLLVEKIIPYPFME